MSLDESVRSVARAIDLLETFTIYSQFPTLQDLIERTGLPKTTAVRLLATLEGRGLVAVREDGSYQLGARFLSWAQIAESRWDVGSAARRIMADLVQEVGETVMVYVLQGVYRIPIAQHEGLHSVRGMVFSGEPAPLLGGATSIALLGDSPELVPQVVEHWGADPERFRVGFEQLRTHGYALTSGEREPGITLTAAPIRDQRGRTLAALVVTGPSSRLDGELLERGVTRLAEAARLISEAGLGNVEALLTRARPHRAR